MTSVRSAVLWPEGHQLSIETLELEEPRENEVLVKIVATGICHTDMVLRDTGAAAAPVVLGHEGAGIVERVGAAVSGYQPGDRVAVSFSSCGTCPSCENEAPSYCNDFFLLNFFGNRPDGSSSLSKGDLAIRSHVFGQSSFSSHIVCPASNLVKVDEAVPLELVGPFGCGFQTGAGAVLNSLNVAKGASVMVLGAGAVGMSAIMAAAHIAEAATVIAVDIKDARLELATAVGATHILNGAVDDFDAAVREICPQGVDYIIDTTGIVAVIEPCVALLAAQGVLGLVAAYEPGATFTFDLLSVMTGGRRIQGVMEGDTDIKTFIPALLEHYKQGRFPVDKIVRYYDFEEINTAIADSESGDTIKAIVKM